jgi:hypothetical protein
MDATMMSPVRGIKCYQPYVDGRNAPDAGTDLMIFIRDAQRETPTSFSDPQFQKVAEIIENSDDHIDAANGLGTTAVVVAANRGDLLMVDFLIRNGAHTAYSDWAGHTAATCAMERADWQMLAYLYEKKLLTAMETFTWEAYRNRTGEVILPMMCYLAAFGDVDEPFALLRRLILEPLPNGRLTGAQELAHTFFADPNMRKVCPEKLEKVAEIYRKQPLRHSVRRLAEGDLTVTVASERCSYTQHVLEAGWNSL